MYFLLTEILNIYRPSRLVPRLFPSYNEYYIYTYYTHSPTMKSKCAFIFVRINIQNSLSTV